MGKKYYIIYWVIYLKTYGFFADVEENKKKSIRRKKSEVFCFIFEIKVKDLRLLL